MNDTDHLARTKREEVAKLEEEQSSTNEFNESPPSDLVAFNELRSCADLERMCRENELQLDPDYQREFVWNDRDQSRFIDSLVKQLPIPSLCISFDFKIKERQVVDGRQRISSINRFLSKESWKLSKLDDVAPELSNKTNIDIRKQHPDIYSSLRNTTIPVTVLRCDLSKQSHQEYLFTIFHRLNSGGMRLTNQEIRNCIFSGSFNDFLKKISSSENFTTLLGDQKPKRYRFTHEEMILRILSFSNSHATYKGPLSKHLNEYMAINRHLNEFEIKELSKKMNAAAEVLISSYNKRKTSFARLSKAIIEALFVGVIRNYHKTAERTTAENRSCVNTLLKDELFSVDALRAGLAAKERVIARLDKAVEIFS